MKRIAAMMLIVLMMVPMGATLAQDGGGDDDLGILDCLPPTPEYLQAVMPNGMPTFAFYNECGVLNLEMPFTLTYSPEMVIASGLGQTALVYNVAPYPVLTGSWNDTNPEFLNLGDDTLPGGSHGLELVTTSYQGVPTPYIMAELHTYNNPVDFQNLMGELMRLLYQNHGYLPGQIMTLSQIRVNPQTLQSWQTTVQLELVDAMLVGAGVFQQADQVNTLTGRIEINLETIGYQPLTATPTILFVGCFESANDWYGNRVLFSFAQKSISATPVG